MNHNSNGMNWKLILLVPVVIQQSVAQSSWQWQNPLPQGDNIAQIQFVNATRGWIVVWSKNLLHTSDGGQTWQLMAANISLRKISFVDENRGWGIGSDHQFTNDAGVYRTTDGGLTWIHQYTDSLWGPFVDLQFTDLRNGWAIGPGFLRHTSDGGVTWQPQTAFVHGGGFDIRVCFRDSLRGWIGGRPFFTSKTVDGGQTWIRDSTLEGYNRFLFVDSLHGWASSTFESWERRMIARTTDGGLTWFQTFAPLRALAFPISQTECLAFGDTGVYRTTNAGGSWTLIHTPGFRDGFVQAATNMWAAQYLSPNFFHSTDGGYVWADQLLDRLGPGYAFLNAVDFVDTLYGWTVGATFGGGRDEFVARTTNGGLTWTKIATGLLSEPLAVSFVSRTTGWITGRSGVIRKTTDGGLTWQQQVSGTTYTLWDVQFLDTSRGFSVGYGTNEGIILRTQNGGSTWVNVTPGSISKIEVVQFVDSTHGWVGGDLTVTGSPPVFFRTTNAGTTWENPILDPSLRIDRFYFVNRNRGWAYGVYPPDPSQTSLMTTSDGGATWIEQERDSTSADMFGGGVSFVDSLTGWMVGHGGSIWFTSNGGLNWQNQTGITAKFLRGIAAVKPRKAWAVGDGGTIISYGTDRPVSVDDDNNIAVPERLYVSPNYPNPFNAQTTIRYRLPKAGVVSLELYDILGRLVMRMYEGYREAGELLLTIKAEGIASGIYFFKLTSGGQHQWGKILLIR